MGGWGTFFGKIGDWMPGRKENRRNKEDKLEREYNELLKKPSTPANVKRLESIANKLRVIKQKNKNG